MAGDSRVKGPVVAATPSSDGQRGGLRPIEWGVLCALALTRWGREMTDEDSGLNATIDAVQRTVLGCLDQRLAQQLQAGASYPPTALEFLRCAAAM